MTDFLSYLYGREKTTKDFNYQKQSDYQHICIACNVHHGNARFCEHKQLVFPCILRWTCNKWKNQWSFSPDDCWRFDNQWNHKDNSGIWESTDSQALVF